MCKVCLKVPTSAPLYNCPEGHITCSSCYGGMTSQVPLMLWGSGVYHLSDWPHTHSEDQTLLPICQLHSEIVHTDRKRASLPILTTYNSKMFKDVRLHFDVWKLLCWFVIMYYISAKRLLINERRKKHEQIWDNMRTTEKIWKARA